MKYSSKLEVALMILVKSPVTAQIDVYLEEQIALHVFNQEDAKNWGYPVPLSDEGGILACLFFNKNKNDNEANYARFKSASFFEGFSLRRSEKGKFSDTYYMAYSNLLPIGQVADDLIEIIKVVYNLETDRDLKIRMSPLEANISFDLYTFIAEQLAVKLSRLQPHTRILQDLGVKGAVAAKFLMAYHQRFGVDMREFPLYDYFAPGGCSPWGLFLIFTGQEKYKSLTIQMLEDGVRTGRLQG